MASVATNATLRDNASVTADGGVAEAADPDEGAGSAEGAPGSLPLETSGGDAGVFTATRKRKADEEDTLGGHRPATDSAGVHVP